MPACYPSSRVQELLLGSHIMNEEATGNLMHNFGLWLEEKVATTNSFGITQSSSHRCRRILSCYNNKFSVAWRPSKSRNSNIGVCFNETTNQPVLIKPGYTEGNLVSFLYGAEDTLGSVKVTANVTNQQLLNAFATHNYDFLEPTPIQIPEHASSSARILQGWRKFFSPGRFSDRIPNWDDNMPNNFASWQIQKDFFGSFPTGNWVREFFPFPL